MLKKTIPLELTQALVDQIEEAAANDAMPSKDWVEQLLIKAVAESKHPGYSSDKHRVLRVFLADLDGKKNRKIESMASEAGVSTTAFADTLRSFPGITLGATNDVTIMPAGVDRLRDALKKPA